MEAIIAFVCALFPSPQMRRDGPAHRVSSRWEHTLIPTLLFIDGLFLASSAICVVLILKSYR